MSVLVENLVKQEKETHRAAMDSHIKVIDSTIASLDPYADREAVEVLTNYKASYVERMEALEEEPKSSGMSNVALMLIPISLFCGFVFGTFFL